MATTVGVVVFPGTNCEMDAVVAVEVGTGRGIVVVRRPAGVGRGIGAPGCAADVRAAAPVFCRSVFRPGGGVAEDEAVTVSIGGCRPRRPVIVNEVGEAFAADRIEGKALAILKDYGDFEYGTAGLYINGEAYLAYADMLFNAPVPKNFSEEEVLLYEEIIAERRIPIEDKGKSRLVRVLDTAKDAGRWSQFQTKALTTLNERFPREFAPEKEEARGTSSASTVRRAGPIPLRVESDDEAGENGGAQ